MNIANNDIKTKAKEKGMCFWQIADKLGISETAICRKLRYELPQEEKNKIFKIIDDFKG